MCIRDKCRAIIPTPSPSSARIWLASRSAAPNRRIHGALSIAWPDWPRSAKEIMLDGRYWDPYGARWGAGC
eukprot:8377175-Alexandrium_andersonii.AAC.1